MAKKRTTIPAHIAAKAIFLSDRTCCVCRIVGKKIQIHHIDENPSNNELSNLSILCFECHTETMIKGGFHRKLDTEQVILYKDDWIKKVSQKRGKLELENPSDKKHDNSDLKIEIATSLSEIYKENEEYELLVMHYDSIKNYELRDKYIDKILKNEPTDNSIIFLKSLQNKGKEVPKEVIDRQISKYNEKRDWLNIARTYKNVQQPIESLKYYLKGISDNLDKGRFFTTAFYLKELQKEGLIDELFSLAYEDATNKNKLWWQVRALQELGHKEELEKLLRNNKDEILNSKDYFLLRVYAKTIGDDKKYIEILKKMASSAYTNMNGGVGFKKSNLEDDEGIK